MTHFSKTAHTTTISNELFEELFWRYTNWLEELSMHCVEDGFSADDLENIAELAGEIADAIAPCYTVNDHIPKSLRTCAEDLRNGAAELRDLEEESEELELEAVSA